MSDIVRGQYRWHRYRLEWTMDDRLVLLNLLNKASIEISGDAFPGPLEGEFTGTGETSLDNALIEQNFVIPSIISDIDLLSSWFARLCDRYDVFDWLIFTTRQCNFDCRYCFQEAHPYFRKDDKACWADILRWMDVTIMTQRPKLLRAILFGGEPLIDLDTLDTISTALAESCRSVSCLFRLFLVTNGYELSPPVLERLLSLGLMHLYITLDGPPSIHDCRRSLRQHALPTFDTILLNIVNASQVDALKIRIRTNLDRHNVCHYETLLDILEARGLKDKIELSIVPTRKPYEGDCDWNHYCFDNGEMPEQIQQCMLVAASRGFRVVSRGIEYGPCIAVTRGGLVIEPNGDIHKCSHFAGSPRYRIGNIVEGVSDNLCSIRLPHPWMQCVECKYVPICSAGCRHDAIRLHNNATARVCRRGFYDKVLIPIYESQLRNRTSDEFRYE